MGEFAKMRLFLWVALAATTILAQEERGVYLCGGVQVDKEKWDCKHKKKGKRTGEQAPPKMKVCRANKDKCGKKKKIFCHPVGWASKDGAKKKNPKKLC